ncbi:DnaJ domain-containing protein [Candidatus Saccharibacteria bacterium]|nr:DnaJ domain-containing protein [Candidatus Saccharibacteria bacterium]
MAKKDYYEVLGVAKGASDDEIKKAFRKAAVASHPDKTGGDDVKFKEVNEAHEVLKDREKRSRYDQFGHAGVGQGPGGYGARGPGGQNVNFDFGDFGDLGDIFGSMFGFGGGRNRARRGADYQTSVTIEFLDAVFGTTREIGARDSKKIKVKIPAGIDDGMSIRLAGKGGDGANGGGKGDLYVQVRVAPSSKWTREGSIILSRVEVSMVTATLGGEVDVETVDGEVTMKIPAGTQGGAEFKLSGRGAVDPRYSDGRRGPHIVQVQVKTPTNLTKKQKAILQEFAESMAKKKGFFR